jgi:hypothetical protein
LVLLIEVVYRFGHTLLAPGWQQTGSNIDGAGGGDKFGSAVSLSDPFTSGGNDSVVAVGAPWSSVK